MSSHVRGRLILYVLLAGLVLLAGRAFYLQWLHADFLNSEADKRQLRVIEVPAPRGQIFDRNNEVLALSAPITSIWVDANRLNSHPNKVNIIAQLAQVIEMSSSDIAARVSDQSNRRYLYISRGQLPEIGQRVEALNLPFVYVKPEYRRFYPQAHTTAHLIGYTNVDDIGQDGIEAIYDNWLTGQTGRFRVVKDLKGRVVSSVATLQPIEAGKDINLTLDSHIQYFAHKALHDALVKHNAFGGSVVVIDLNTSEILALANQPSFNPNDRTQITGEAIRNRGISTLVEPGSTIKPLVIAKLLDAGLITADEVVSTHPGHIRLYGHLISDAINYRELDITGVVQKSSNVAMAKLVPRLSREAHWEFMTQLGFGADSGLFLPGEQSGRLRHFANWSRMDQVSNSFGYGFNATLLQLAQSYQIFGQQGQVTPLRLVADQPHGAPKQVVSPETAQAVLLMMESVTQPGGTATEAKIDGYRVAGKTGTVHKTAGGVYQLDKYQAMFVGLAPVSRPQLLVAVMIDEPSRGIYGGGTVAAPVFREVMTHALRVRNIDPDQVNVP
ncbi:peptidoglycan D,D-transpeptidase FtsI family protein [Thiomicrospira cyclica]|uniref:Peptidoglycan glycosyltransferase n=1 Tax=Thiomicrospira cyclica (strain DSM 14477 / JCM 11371 / ALM1) TaxID=717773 RepID=F6D9R3_THICA|nr:penicillin-binding transpeptidase domain-containing protein [Thiomicrospira cyclica]AEG32112.1 Peptidoglycan glycosyltransferase [Thiomicrospira cyclica ALM1]